MYFALSVFFKIRIWFYTFKTISISIINHYQTILNYFENRRTKASAEMKFMNT